MICPNLSNPVVKAEFDELKAALGEDMAYLIWDRNNGFPMDKTSTGKPSKLFNDLLGLTSRQNAIEIKAKTLSDAFKQWFGNSKVVDENGEPLIVYHGIDKKVEINSFDKSKIGSRSSLTNDLKKPAFYFMNDIHNATEYAMNVQHGIKTGNVYPTFLSIQNPIKESGKGYGVRISDVIREKNINERLTSDVDGIIISDIYDSPIYSDLPTGTTLAVFEPNQIKSIFNTGVFNRYSDNIYDNDIVNQEVNHQQTKINGSMSTEIVSNFETYFPDYTYLNDDQRKVVADLVEQGRIQLSCTI